MGTLRNLVKLGMLGYPWNWSKSWAREGGKIPIEKFCGKGKVGSRSDQNWHCILCADVIMLSMLMNKAMIKDVKVANKAIKVLKSTELPLRFVKLTGELWYITSGNHCSLQLWMPDSSLSLSDHKEPKDIEKKRKCD